MEDLKDLLNSSIDEAHDPKGEAIPVMYNIYGDPINNPWYFGYSRQEQIGRQMNVWTTGLAYNEWAKIVVPFEKFDPHNLKQNLKFNLIK